MTAFIVQAREEAVRLNRENNLPRGYLSVFALGAVWGREQEPTEAEVEAAAIECVKFLFLTAPERPWEDPEVVEQWKPMARIALRGARRDGGLTP